MNCVTTGSFWRGWNRLPEKRNPANWAGLRGFCIQPLSGKIENCMNDKRFTFKMLGVFLMEAMNVSPKEVRKTFWHVVGGLILLILAFRLPEILAVLLR
ncbi:hypothetical protein [Eikenella exigua]|nr:hypothetical protein [Eikenella exigua]